LRKFVKAPLQYNKPLVGFRSLVLLVLLLAWHLHAVDAVCLARSDDDQNVTARVKVLDPEGNPVADASVTFHTRGIAWRSVKELGPRPTINTNQQGIAELRILADTARKRSLLSDLLVTVGHPDFVVKRADCFPRRNEETNVFLERGFRIAATAVDGATGNRLENDLYATSAPYGGSWESKNNGTVVSPMLKLGRVRFRVMQISEEYPDKFSNLIVEDAGERTRVMRRDIKLFPGVRVEGRLDESVQRPVVNGYVSGRILSQETDNPPISSAWKWNVKAKIDPDGTFVFESLPRDTTLQLIPFCDGWNSVNPLREEVKEMLPRAAGNEFKGALRPHVVHLTDQDATTVLPMERMAKVTFRVQTQSGKPLAGARVHSFPSQFWFPSGTQKFGAAFSDRASLLKLPLNRSVTPPVFDQRTDDTGRVTMQLPSYKGDRFWASHPDFDRYSENAANFEPGENDDVHLFLGPSKEQ